MGNKFGKGNDSGGGSGLPHHSTIEKRLCITVPEAPEMLGISRNFAYELVKRGELPSIRLGEKRILIPKIALEKRLEEAR